MSDLTPWLPMDDSRMDEILKVWKSKSLNSMPTQKYRIPIKNFKKQQSVNKKTSKKQISDSKTPTDTKQTLPEPKITKIKQSTFCIYLNSQLIVFIFATQDQKQISKVKTTFRTIPFSFHDTIKFVVGNNSDSIYVGFQNEFHILNFQWSTEKTEEGKEIRMIKQVVKGQIKSVPKLKGLSFVQQKKNSIIGSILIAVSNQKMFKYAINDNYRLLGELKLNFQSSKDQQTLQEIKAIQMLCQNNAYLYLFGTKEGLQQQMNEGSGGGTARKRKCQFLYLIKFTLNWKNNEPTPVNLSMIDHVFETGIFGKSKIFQAGPSVFLISLYEQIIVVKYHFQKYVVWDNISLISSKSNQKKGQLVLADKIVMVYTEMGQIFAHNIFFSTRDSKLKYPRIDNFKGNDNDEQILYDAIVLQYEPGSFMKVLFYFKQMDVYSPNNKVPIHKEQRGHGDNKQFLFFNILCIQQNSPLNKLGQLFRNKKMPQQIAEFVQRFDINQLDKSKCQWSVSQKTQKDIENLLLQIKDNQFIQFQLTQILKSSPHDLKFLSKIQRKQVQRYKKMLITKLLKNDRYVSSQQQNKLKQETGRLYTKQEIQQIKLIIKWVMQSIMFEKKLVYSKNFLQFMEYDFIQIGKLKAASLREQIKLLSCKGYEKRLQYFLNSFKYMILANFENIFQFLVQDKNQAEIQKFFVQNFRFILPKFEQTSEIFRKKRSSDPQSQSKARRHSFAPDRLQLRQIKEQTYKQDDKCQLWENKFDDPAQIRKIQTKQSFKKQIQQEIKKTTGQQDKQGNKKISHNLMGIKKQNAIQQFQRILDQFVRGKWFEQNKSKLHSIIQLDVKKLQNKMLKLKEIGVFNLLIKIFYGKIAKGEYNLQKVDQVLEQFKKKNLIPESFEYNVLIRRQVFRKIRQLRKPGIQLPILQDFLIYQETVYFQFLFKNYRELLLNKIKQVYDEKIKGLFKQKFKIYLNSDRIVLSQIINFLDEFEGNNNDQIRMDVFTCIKKILRINDKQSTLSFVNKLMDKQVLKNQKSSQGSIDALIDEAKVAFGSYFYDLFRIFNISMTYAQLIEQTTTSDYDKCKVIKEILEKYCQDDYEGAPFKSNSQQQSVGQHLSEMRKQKIIKNGDGFYKQKQNSNQQKQRETISIKQSKFVGSLQNSQKIKQNLQFYEYPNKKQSMMGSLQKEFKKDELRQQLQEQYQVILSFQEQFGLQRIQIPINEQPLQFFGVVLYLIDTLRFQIKPDTVFDKFVQLLLKYHKYDQLVTFIYDFKTLIGKQVTDSQQLQQSGQIKCRNENLLDQFYHADGIDVKERVIENILIWTRRKYKQVYDYQRKSSMSPSYYNKTYDDTFHTISLTFKQVLDELNLKNAQTIRQRSFLEMLQHIKELQEPQLIYYILKQRFQNFNGNFLQQNSSLLNQLSSFIFMIRLLKQIPKEKFDSDDTNKINMEIISMESIYIQFKSASKFNCKNQNKLEQQSGLVRFYMELAMTLIQAKQFVYCSQVIYKIINNDFYYRDVFLQFLANIKKCNGQPNQKQFKNFVKDCISASSSKVVEAKLKDFLKIYSITQFIGSEKEEREEIKTSAQWAMIKPALKEPPNVLQADKKRRSTVAVVNRDRGNKLILDLFGNLASKLQPVTQNQQNSSSHFTILIYQCLIQSHRVDQAYYFLVRNNALNVMQTFDLEGENQNAEAYALISIYIKCLQNFLCAEFYPTFGFYRNKYSMLINQYERKDIIKDINIAISRMKQMIADLKLRIGNYQRMVKDGKQLTAALIGQSINIDNDNDTKKSQSQKSDKGQNQFDKNDKLQNLRQKQSQLEQKLSQLQAIYVKFMEASHLDPHIKLNEQELMKGKLRFDTMNRQITPDQLSNINRDRPIESSNRQMIASPRFQTHMITSQELLNKQNEELQAQKRKIKQNPKYIELEKQINDQLRQTKMISQKFEPIPQQKSKPSSYKSKNMKNYNDLKEKQKQQMQSIKESYKSPTSLRVDQIIQEMRLRKSKIYEKSDTKSKYSGVWVQDSEPARSRKGSMENVYMIKKPPIPKTTGDLMHPPHLLLEKKSSGLESEGSQIDISRKYEVKLHGVDGNTKNIYMPVTMNNQSKDASRVSIRPHSQIDQIKRRQQSQVVSSNIGQRYNLTKSNAMMKSNVGSHNTLQELTKLFQQKQPQCTKYIQKLQFVKNNLQVGLQITKNIYSSIHHFQVFVKYLGYMLQANPKYKQVLQEKAYKIASQAMGIQYKINLKELFPVQIFFTIVNTPLKQYYKTAYEILKTNLMKILSRSDTNVHGIAILYRFGFGSQNTYYYRVYEDYIKVLIKQYFENPTDDKKMFLLAEKLRTLYNNINTENRQSKFEQLMREIPSEPKRKGLAKQMIKILDRRNQMLTGQKQSDLRDVLTKLA